MTDPLALLRADRAKARAAGDPQGNLCVLATVDGGEPQARTLVLREIETAAGGAPRLGVFLNATSAKYRQLGQSTAVTVHVHLASVAAQYRLVCRLEPVPKAIVEASWRLRPAVAKRLDWLYERHPQGSAVAGREALAAMLATPCPEFAPDSALGFYLAPTAVERLLLDQPDGVHDRRRYRLTPNAWQEEVLVP